MTVHYIFLSLGVIYHVTVTSSLPDVIKIGAMFETGDDTLLTAFSTAVDSMNSESFRLSNFRLSSIIQQLEQQDSFQASKKVCDLLEKGVAAIFGPQSEESSSTVQSFCDAMHVPHIEIRWDFRTHGDNHSVNLFPFTTSLSKAYYEYVKHKNWKSFAIVYEENEALVRLQELLKDPSIRKRRVIVKQFVQGRDYRKIIKELGRAGVKNFIIDVPSEKIRTVLKQAQQVDMMSEYHNYFLTSLDLHTVDLKDFQYGGTNISAFSLVDEKGQQYINFLRNWKTGYPGLDNENSKPALKTDVALMYDAVKLFSAALRDLDKTNQKIFVRPISCQTEQPWTHGKDIINKMRKISINGLTGNVKFDENGFRSDFNLKILQLTQQGLKEIGKWTPRSGINMTGNFSKAYEEAIQSLKNKTLIVTTLLNAPYMILKEDRTKALTGNDRYHGYCVDLIREISKIRGFKYTIKEVSDKTYGKKNKHGEWNGMIRELIDGNADIAIGDLTITYEREEVVDFTMPFMNLGISILFRKPAKKVPKLFSFLSPLSLEVWVYMVTAFLGVSIFLFVVARFSPYEWTNPHPCEPEPDTLENQFSLLNTLWFTIGCLMQQGSELTPKAMSTRVVAGIWWFFTLIMVSSYTANLAAFLTVERLVTPIESADDLAKQSTIHYGCVQSGSTQAFFEESNIPTYKRMWNFMESTRPRVFVESIEKGVERVRNENYAFLMESTTIEYLVERKCDLMQVGGLLDTKGFGIATPSGSPYRTAISSAILKLQESGALHILKRRWWKQEDPQCEQEVKTGSGRASELGLDNVGGVFVVLMAGLGFACVIVLGEFTWKSRKVAVEEREPLCVELCKELKFAITCGGSTKPIEKSRENHQPTNSLHFMPLTSFENVGAKEIVS
ncbi:glutamate receptor ionotropic, kainate 2-like [Tachypleus tridentatus]|uniref:glutamate receptor ionotropic, kainate 2-like n=1 Tax=Tachypleus tridentatus TaxID=6853 RepID=UPI003FD4AFB4